MIVITVMAVYVIATCSIDQQRSGYSHCLNGFFKQQDLYRWSATHVLFHKKIMWTPSIGHHGPLGVHGPPVEKPCIRRNIYTQSHWCNQWRT